MAKTRKALEPTADEIDPDAAPIVAQAAKMAAPAKKSAPAKAPVKAKAAAPEPEEDADEEEEEDADEEAVEEADDAAEEETAAAEDELTVHDHLLDLARSVDKKFPDQTTKEDDQTYFKRLITAIADEPENKAGETEGFDALPQEAQDWYNEQGERMQSGKDIEAPEGFVSKKSAPAKKAAKGEKPVKAAGEKAPAKAKEPRAVSPSFALRVALCKNPDADLAKLLVDFEHINKSSVTTIRSDVLATLRAAKEAGVLKA